jgi:hypothetical protein
LPAAKMSNRSRFEHSSYSISVQSVFIDRK